MNCIHICRGYSRDHRPDKQKQLFISRVPLNIKDARELVGKAPAMALEPVEGYEDYSFTELPAC